MTVKSNASTHKPIHPFFSKRPAVTSTYQSKEGHKLPISDFGTIFTSTAAIAPVAATTAATAPDDCTQSPAASPLSYHSKSASLNVVLKERSARSRDIAPAESSMTEAKRYAKYRQIMKEQIAEEERQQHQPWGDDLSPIEQLMRDFYGCLLDKPEPKELPGLPCYRTYTKGRTAVWPNMDIYEGGHITQLDNTPHHDHRRRTKCQYTRMETNSDADLCIKSLMNGTSPIAPGTAPSSSDLCSWKEGGRSSSISAHSAFSTPSTSTTVYFTKEKIEAFMDSTYKDAWRTVPACETLMASIFDSGSTSTATESLAWPEKYRPNRAIHLLGNRPCHGFLYSWLEERKMASAKIPMKPDVSDHLDINALSIKESLSENGKMDCIDGEADDTDNDDDSGDEYVPGAKKATKKPRERKRMTNVILLYGPHGVGKTASVYTAAQELGYEVFEINPSSRRSGKDLMAAVGEMIESHQVNFQEGDASRQFADLANMFQETALLKKRQKEDKELGRSKKRKKNAKDSQANGKGSIMSHFALASKPAAPPEPVPMLVDDHDNDEQQPSLQPRPAKPGDNEDTDDVDIMDITQEDGENSDSVVQPLTVAAAAAAATAPNSHIPRQSLVLIEEVDILFEEDKGFWSAIVELSEKSKRPIILTCNDIDVLPIESLAFDKMLEFVPQSTKTLIPYLQLVCLNEGYIVDPLDLMHLVAAVGNDLRQLIQTLEVWCKQPQLVTGDDGGNQRRQQRKVSRAAADHPKDGQDVKCFATCPRLFGRYMGIKQGGRIDRRNMSKEPYWNDVDVEQLSQLYYNKVVNEKPRAQSIAEAMLSVKLDAVVEGLETAAFVDSYIERPPKRQHYMQDSQITDQLAGYSGTLLAGDENDPRLVNVGSAIMELSTGRLKNRKWQSEIRHGYALWKELCDIRTTAFQECTEAVSRLLNLRLASVPDRSVIMAEYVPSIRAMCVEESMMTKKDNSRARSTRRPVRRRRRNWTLDQDNVEVLNREQAVENITRQWHEQASRYNDYWKKNM